MYSSPIEYVDGMGQVTVSLPTKDWSWVDVEMDPVERQYDIMGAGKGSTAATNVEDAPTSLKRIGRAWIDDIPD